MNGRVLIVCVLLLSALSMSSCDRGYHTSFTEVRSDRAKLLAPFESYAGIEEVRALLRDRNLAWNVSENNRTVGEGERRPPFWVHGIEVHNYESFGVPGRLILRFFNNRLYSTTFFPDHAPSFIGELEKQIGIKLVDEIKLEGATVLRRGMDFEHKLYVEWEDVRIADELHRWIMENA